MRILVVDDSDVKSSRIERCLRECEGGYVLLIDRAASYTDAINHLTQTSYDLMILDIVLPVRTGQLPEAEFGRQILAEVFDGVDCHPPTHIICLSEFQEALENVRSDAERRLVHLVLYNETKIEWLNALRAKVNYLSKRSVKLEEGNHEFSTDVAILTSSPSVELAAVLNLPGDLFGEYQRIDALHYFVGQWRRTGQRVLSIVACAAPSMGMTSACVTACKIIHRWRPRFLVMTGIAAGTKKDLHYGDVLVAESAYDYGSGKILEGRRGRREFVPSPCQRSIDPELLALMQLWERGQLKMDVVRMGWHTPLPRVPKIAVGILASGAAVVQDRRLVTEILKTSRKVVGLEMEAYGVFQAGFFSGQPKPRVLVAKSVCDFADKRKGDRWQQYAAYTSARFVYEFFTNATELPIGTIVDL